MIKSSIDTCNLNLTNAMKGCHPLVTRKYARIGASQKYIAKKPYPLSQFYAVDLILFGANCNDFQGRERDIFQTFLMGIAEDICGNQSFFCPLSLKIDTPYVEGGGSRAVLKGFQLRSQ